MLVLLLAAAVAHGAEPGPPPLAIPPVVGVAALGGADRFTGGGGATGELRAGVGADLGRWRAGTGAALQLIDDRGALLLADHLRGTAGWGARGRVAPAADLSVSGSGSDPWVSSLLTVGLDARGASARGGVRVGGGVRAAGATVGPEAVGTLTIGVPLGQVSSATSASARVLGGALPPVVLDASQWLTVGERLRVELGAVVTAAPASDAPAVSGLPTPGTVVLQALGAGSWSVTDRWSVRLELGPEGAWGSTPYQRFRALAGLRADLGAFGPREPVATASGVRFEVRAPDADRVEVLGAFSGWSPLPMAREGGRWSVEVDVPPGSWEFVYVVDGRTVAPPAADRYVPDGYGGTNGVIVVRP